MTYARPFFPSLTFTRTFQFLQLCCLFTNSLQNSCLKKLKKPYRYKILHQQGLKYINTKNFYLSNTIFYNTIQCSKTIFPIDFLSFFISSSIIRNTYFINPNSFNFGNFGSYFRFKSKPAFLKI